MELLEILNYFKFNCNTLLLNNNKVHVIYRAASNKFILKYINLFHKYTEYDNSRNFTFEYKNRLELLLNLSRYEYELKYISDKQIDKFLNIVFNKYKFLYEEKFNFYYKCYFSLIERELPFLTNLFLNNRINHKNTINQNVLHYACLANNYELVKYLLENYSDKDVKDDLGNFPIFYTTDNEIKELIEDYKLIINCKK